MKTFALHRNEDVSGTSGTGKVAQGVEFDDGTVALRWLTRYRSTAFYANAGDLETIHGHDGKTRVVWDGEGLSMTKSRQRLFAANGQRHFPQCWLTDYHDGDCYDALSNRLFFGDAEDQP